MTEISDRKVQFSVTIFLHCGEEYLFLHRDKSKRVDPDKLNGIGGRVEPEENYLDAAIREAKEETGYVLEVKDLELVTVGKLEGGYPEDWMMCFFRAEVGSKEVPRGMRTSDGELVWLHRDKVLDSGYELVDDLNHCFRDIARGDSLMFFNGQVNAEEKIEKISISKLSKQ